MQQQQQHLDDLDAIIRISRKEEQLQDPYVLHNLCLSQDLDLLLPLLERDNRGIDGRNQNGLAPLHISVVSADPPRLEDLISFLLYHGADVNKTCAPSDDNSLHLAVIFSKLDNAEISVPLLLREGANPLHRNFAGRTPRDYALANGYEDLAALLLEIELHPERRPEIDPYNWKEKFGANTKSLKQQFIDAVRSGNSSFAADLLKRMSDKEKQSINSLHSAVEFGAGDKQEMVDALVQAGADTNEVDASGDTPIQLAIKQLPNDENLVEIVRILLAAGVPKETKNKEGKTALAMARQREYNEVAQLLEDPEPEVRPEGTQQMQRNRPAQQTRRSVHSVLNEKTLTMKSKLQELRRMWELKPRPNPNELSTDGRDDTPLHVTVRRDQEMLTDFFLEKGATVYVKNKRRETPLMLAQQTEFGSNMTVYNKLRNANRKQIARGNWHKFASAI